MNYKKIVSIVLIIALFIIGIGERITVPVKGAMHKETSFFGVRDANYFLYNGSEWLENLLFVKDSTLEELTTDNPDRVYFDELSDISNEFFEAHKPVYCMEANAAYPWGCTYTSDKYLSESPYTLEQISLIENVVRNGYPANKLYWYEHGVKSYGAQMMATQAAVWIITGGFGTSVNQVSYDAAAFSVNSDKYSKEETGGLMDMLEELISCGQDSNYCVNESHAYVYKYDCVQQGNYYDYEYTLDMENIAAARLKVEGISGAFEMWIDDESIEYSDNMQVSTDAVRVKLRAEAAANYDKQVSLILTADTTHTSADMLYWYDSDEKVEKWPGSGLFSRQQVLECAYDIVELEDKATHITGYIEKKCVLSIYKSGEVLSSFDEDKGFIYTTGGIAGAGYGVYSDESCSEASLVERLVTDKDGYALTTVQLSKGNYYVKEITAPIGYELDTTVYTVVFKGGFTTEEIELVNLSVKDNRINYELEVYKTDEVNNPLSDITFDIFSREPIYNHEGERILSAGAYIETIKTDDEGIAHTSFAYPQGNYYLKENNTSEYYVVPDSDINFSFKDKKTQQQKVINTSKKIQLLISKTGNVLTDFMNGSFIYEDRSVSNVSFGIYSKEGCEEESLLEIITTDKDGIASSGLYKLKDYSILYVKELVAAPGCVLDDKVYPVELKNDADTEVKVEKISLRNERTKVSLNVKKTDNESRLPVKGAVFCLKNNEDIMNYEGKVILKKNSIISEGIESDKDGNVHFDANVPVDYTYTAFETAAPHGYVKEEKTAVFTPAYDMKEKEISIVKEIANTKQYGRIEVIKTGQVLIDYRDDFIYSDKPLGGIVFGIYSDEKCSNLLEKLTTDSSGRCVSTLYEENTYYVKEIKTNDGLIIDETIYPVNITYDNNSVVTTKTLRLANKRKIPEYHIYKLGSDGNIPLCNAEFTISTGKDIYDYSGMRLLVAKGSVIEKISSDKSGCANYSKSYPYDAQLVIKEIVAPQKYEISEKEWVIKNGEKLDIINTPLIGRIECVYVPDKNLYHGDISLEKNNKKENVVPNTPNTPDTGDESSLLLWLGAFVLSGIVLCFCKKKKKVLITFAAFIICMLPLTNAYADEINVDSPVVYENEYSFEESIVSGGKTYHLKNTERIAAPITGRSEHIAQTYRYEAYEEKDIPREVSTYVYDDITDTQVQGLLTSVYIKPVSQNWKPDFEFIIRCYDVNGKYFVYNGKKYVYDSDNPDMSVIELQLLKDMGLSKDEYRVLSYEFSGDEYILDGKNMRDIEVKGERFVTDYEVLYEGDIPLPDNTNAHFFRASYEYIEKQPETVQEVVTEYETESVTQPETYAEIQPQTQPDTKQETEIETNETDYSYLLIPLILLAVMLLMIIAATKRRRTRK